MGRSSGVARGGKDAMYQPPIDQHRLYHTNIPSLTLNYCLQEENWPGNSKGEAAQQRGENIDSDSQSELCILGEASAPSQGEPGRGLPGQLPDPPRRHRGVRGHLPHPVLRCQEESCDGITMTPK